MDRSARQHWDRIALRWRISPPLAPAAEDLDWYQRRVVQHLRSAGSALLLGVTAGILRLRWPEDARRLSADWSMEMLKNVWPSARETEGWSRTCADWRRLPLADGAFDLVIGDGCYSALHGLQQMSLLNREVRRVLRPGGHMLIRTFCRPQERLRPAELFGDLKAGRIRNLDLFRWLLAMAVQGNSPNGVSLREVWETWSGQVPDPRALQGRLGWSEDALLNMERWANSEMTYSFPSLRELRAIAAPGFSVEACERPTYEWGALFPRLALRALP